MDNVAVQIPLLDLVRPEVHKQQGKLRKTERKKIEQMFSQVHQLHEQINAYLYKCPVDERPCINSPSDAAEILKTFMGNHEQEELWLLLLDRRNRVLKIVKLYQGSVSSSQVRVGEVFRQPIIEQASAIIVAHNHPSGDPTPSPDDVAVTRAMVQAGKLLDIEVLDHVVICADRHVSLKERGLGFS